MLSESTELEPGEVATLESERRDESSESVAVLPEPAVHARPSQHVKSIRMALPSPLVRALTSLAISRVGARRESDCLKRIKARRAEPGPNSGPGRPALTIGWATCRRGLGFDSRWQPRVMRRLRGEAHDTRGGGGVEARVGLEFRNSLTIPARPGTSMGFGIDYKANCWPLHLQPI